MIELVGLEPQREVEVAIVNPHNCTTRRHIWLMRMGELRIGTSGWHYKHWRGNFYPEKLPVSRWLDFYAQHFDTVELNNSFYRLPQIAALDTWRDSTPAGFCFAAKASRFITHNKKLKDPENALHKLLPRLETLASKLGPILFQLPPKWKCNAERLRELLALLPRRHRYAFEFREPSWICEAALEVLRRYNAAFCIYQLAGFHSPLVLTADWTYVRLHGPGGKYQGSYSDAQLMRWAERIAQWQRQLNAIHIYFDNDQHGYAAHNAMQLKELMAQSRQRAA